MFAARAIRVLVLTALCVAWGGCARDGAQGGQAQGGVGSTVDGPASTQLGPPQENLGMFGEGGQALELTVRCFTALQGQMPATTADLHPYLPFHDSLRGLTLGRSDGPRGAILTAERPVDHPASRTGSDPAPHAEPGFADYNPPIGIQDGIQRGVVASLLPEETGWRFAPEQRWGAGQILSDAVQGFARMPVEDCTALGIEPPTSAFIAAAPDWRPSTAEVAFATLIQLVDLAAYHFPPQQPSGQPAKSLGELAEFSGGLNAAAWVNPYTGAPMNDVPLGAPSAGDYSEVSTPESFEIAFHFLGPEQRIVTFRVGKQRIFDATGTADIISGH